MKRLFSFILAGILLLTTTGCYDSSVSEDVTSEPSQSPVTISVLYHEQYSTLMDEMEKLVENLYSYIDVEGIEIPLEYAERDSLYTNLKTEIMAGGGPDVYLLETDIPGTYIDNGSAVKQSEAFFRDVEESMRNRLFLSLDDLMEESEYLSNGRQNTVIMRTGTVGENQYVLPLSYTYCLLLADKNRLADPTFTYSTIEELLSCEDEDLVADIKMLSQHWFGAQFPKIADYENNQLLIDYSDIEKAIRNIGEWVPYTGDGNSVLLNEYYTGTGKIFLSQTVLDIWHQNEENAYPIYFPNSDGGITAYITHYAAINSNSKHPNEAFKFVELLFSDHVLQGAPYGENYTNAFNASIEEFSLLGPGTLSVDFGTFARESHINMLESLNSKITDVRFYSAIDVMIYNSVDQALDSFNDDARISKVSEELYSKIQMEMAE